MSFRPLTGNNFINLQTYSILAAAFQMFSSPYGEQFYKLKEGGKIVKETLKFSSPYGEQFYKL